MTPLSDDRATAGSVLAALFDDGDAAARAMTNLRAAGYNRVEISEAGRTGKSATSAATDIVGSDQTIEENRSAKPIFFQEHDSGASSFVKELIDLGFRDRDAHDLVDGLIGGGALVTADAGTTSDRAAEILLEHSGDVRYARVIRAPKADDASDAEADHTIALRSERLSVEKKRVQHGEARIRKEVVTHMETIDVPVSREELVIEQISVHEEPTGEASIDSDETIRIPLSEERVHVSKTIEAKGDVIIGKREVADVTHVSETLREERLQINDPTTHSTTSSTTEKP